MLTKRTVELFRILKSENNLKNIAERMSLTERAVRYEKENLYYYLDKFGLLDIRRNEKAILSDIKNISEKEFLENINNENYSFSKEERESFITACCFFKRNLKQKYFEENLKASSGTISADIQRVKVKMAAYDLNVERDNKKGYFIKGNEKKIRQMMLNFLLDYLFVSSEFYMEVVIKEIIGEYFKNINLISIEKFLKNVQKDLNKIISDEAHKILKIYLLIIVKRTGENRILTEINNKNMIENSEEYKVMSNLLPVFEKENGINILDSEKYLLCEYILGSHSYNFSYSYYENWFQLEILVNKLIIGINSLIDVNILGDKILTEGLINHLRPAIYRIKQGIKLENSIYEEILENDPYLFKIISLEMKKFKGFLEVDINKDEIAFLTIHFREAINRREAAGSKNVIIVCGFGYGSSKLLKENIRNYFDVNIVGIMPLHKFYQIEDFSNIDLIITTVPIENKSLNIAEVSPILTDENIITLEKAGLLRERKRINVDEFLEYILEYVKLDKLNTLKEKIMEKYPQRFIKIREDSTLTKFLKKENIYVNMEFQNWEESIKFLGDKLIKEGAAGTEYISSITDILKKHGTYMILNKNILLAHGKNENNVYNTSIYLMTLKESVVFPGEKNIKYIILFSSKDGNEHMEALGKLTELIVEERLFENLKDSFSAGEVYNFINQMI